MNTHELADTLKGKPAADIYLFGGYEGEQTILLPFRIEYSSDNTKAVVVPDLPVQGEEDVTDLATAMEKQGQLPTINEEVVERLFTEFELGRLDSLQKEWEKEESPDRPPFVAVIMEAILTEDKLKQINEATSQPNDPKFWSYVLEAYTLNVLQKKE